MRPFVRQRFHEIPERPTRPHAFDDARVETLRMSSAAFGSVEVHVRSWGEGPPLLLVHGLMTSSYSWRYIAPALAQRFRVIAPDVIGAGRSTKVLDRPYSAANYARWLIELVDALQIRGAPAFGNSLGGYMCMQAALADPGVFSRLVNLHSPGLREPRLYALRAALSVPGIQPGLAWWIRRAPLEWAHANVHYYDESLKSLEEAREYGEPLASHEGSRAFARILSEVLAPPELAVFERTLGERRARGASFPIPLLLVYARTDPMVPPSMGARLHGLIPSAELVWLEATSHFAHVDTPDAVRDVVLPFLSR